MYDDEDYLVECMEVGGHGYVLKDSPAPQLLAAIRDVYRGGSYLSPKMLSQLVGDLRSRIKTTHRQPRVATLTPREKEILKFLAEGQSVKEIATHLNLSDKTEKQVQLDAQARHPQQGAAGPLRRSPQDHQDSHQTDFLQSIWRVMKGGWVFDPDELRPPAGSYGTGLRGGVSGASRPERHPRGGRPQDRASFLANVDTLICIASVILVCGDAR